MPEREVWIQTKYKTFFAGNGRWLVVGAGLGRLALFKGEGRVRDDFKPVAVGVNAHPSPSSSPLQ